MTLPNSRRSITVAVLMGGASKECEISLKSGERVAGALRDNGYQIREVTLGADMSQIYPLLNPKPDCVFNALHGRRGEDGCVQGMLELMGIPYTHSGVLASALAMDKALCQQFCESQGIIHPPIRVVHRDSWTKDDGPPMPYPYVVKPINEGSSFGVRIVRDSSQATDQAIDQATGQAVDQAIDQAIDQAVGAGDFTDCDRVIVQQYIEGRELTVAVFDNRPLGVLEIRPEGPFYDTHSKYAKGGSRHVVPAPVSDIIRDQCLEWARIAHQSLGCKGVSRSDFIYREEDDQLYMIEINNQPGMTESSLVPEIAAHAGISFTDLVCGLVEEAMA